MRRRSSTWTGRSRPLQTHGVTFTNRLAFGTRLAKHFDEWLGGSVDYDEFCRKDTSLWKGSPLDVIHGFLDRIELNRHVPSVTGALTRRGIPSIIISSGFHHVARRIQSEHRWEPLVVYANELIEGPDVRIHVSADASSPISKRALGTDAAEAAWY